MSDERSGADTAAPWFAVGELYHRFLTGLLLALITRQGTDRATEVVYRTFRRQHLELFLPGLAKLDLDQLPHAVACAQYHVLSNQLGGVGVEWIPESDTKSWVRYLPPRWIFDGTAVCGVPTEVSRAMLRGWHGHNGQSLGNDRLGFVATMQTTDGQPGLEGYYIEEDAPLPIEDRVRFRPGERPANEPVPLPQPDWGIERLAKVTRNYAIAYICSILPELCNVLGPADAAGTGRTAARQIGMQYHHEIMYRAHPKIVYEDVPLADRMAALLDAHGSRVDAVADGDRIAITRNELFPAESPAELYEVWTGLWEGLAMMEGRQLFVVADGPTPTWELR